MTSPPGFDLLTAVTSGDITSARALVTKTPSLANMQDYDHRTPLHIACALGHTAIAKELIASGADWTRLDRQGKSPLQLAIKNGRVRTLRALSEAAVEGAPVAVDPWYSLGRDLLCVVGAGNVVAARQLVRWFGARVNYANADARTALHIAVCGRDVEMVHFLLGAGADTESRDRWGVSPRMEAVRVGDDDIVRLFEGYSRGVDIVRAAVVV